MANSPHFRFASVTEHAVAALARPTGGALANAGIVTLGEDVLVFDTSLNPLAATDLVEASVRRTGRRPTIAANSHWHLDHLLGNQVFAERPILATRRTRDLVLARRRSSLAQVRPGALARDMRQLATWRRRAPDASTRRYLGSVLALHRWLLRAAPGLRWTPPNRTFVRRFRLPGPGRAELRCFGSGHTESDAVLHLPADGLVFAGDLVVVGSHPNLTSGDPEHWLTVLDAIDRLRPEGIVPGHGPVARGDATGPMRDYLRSLLRLAATRGAVPVPSAYARWLGRPQFEQNLAFVRRRARAR